MPVENIMFWSCLPHVLTHILTSNRQLMCGRGDNRQRKCEGTSDSLLLMSYDITAAVWGSVCVNVCATSCMYHVPLQLTYPIYSQSRGTPDLQGRTTDHAHNVSGWQQYIEAWGSAFDPCRPLVWLQVASPLLPIRPKCLVRWSREKIAMNWGLVCSCLQPFVLMEKLPWYNPSLNESLTSEAFAHENETLNLCSSSQLFQV